MTIATTNGNVMWLKSKNPASEAVRREREEEWRKTRPPQGRDFHKRDNATKFPRALPCSRSDFARRGRQTRSNALVTLSPFPGEPGESAQRIRHSARPLTPVIT